MTFPQKFYEAVEVAAAWCALTLMAPLFLLIMLAIRLTTNGPVFQKQERVGAQGRRVALWKFCTTTKPLSALAQNGTPRDHNFTVVGAWLERLSIAEVPKLYSVACGDLHLIEPGTVAFAQPSGKPAMPALAELRAKPGLISARPRA